MDAAEPAISPNFLDFIRKRMAKSNELFFAIGLIGIILCCLPNMLHWSFDFGTYERETSPIFEALHSVQFKYSLAASVALSVPLIIDLFLDSYTADMKVDLRYSVRTIILAALFIPDLLISLSSDLSNGVELLNIIYHSRGIMCLCALLVHLYNFGGAVFQTKELLLSYTLGVTGGVLSCLSSYQSGIVAHQFYYIYTSFFVLASILGIHLVIKWCIHLHKIGLNHITNDHYTCNIYIVSLCAFGITELIMGFFYGPPISAESTSDYLTISTYVDIVITLNIALLHGRLIRQEMTHTKVRMNDNELLILL